MKLCLASGNAHKAQEFQQLADAGALRGVLRIATAREACGAMPNVVEDTGTFTGNARKKARALHEKLRTFEPLPELWSAVAERSGDTAFGDSQNPSARESAAADPLPPRSIKRAGAWWIMSDDSGLCVDALDGAPGVESAYYAGPQADGAANLAKLVRVMRDVPGENRAAHFVCVLVLISPDGKEHIFEARCDGRLARAPRGGGGFGYDPLFIPDGFDQTFSELGEPEKNALSHRARAWKQAETFLKNLKS